MKFIESVRSAYVKLTLYENDIDRDPFVQFKNWLHEAIDNEEIYEPNAMALSTVDSLGQPSSRMVLLRLITDEGFGFYTNFASRKAVEIDTNPRASLLFFWSPLHRQVRIEGEIGKMDESIADKYFAERPRDSQISAWASPQSAVVPDRASLEKNYNQYMKRHENNPVPRPSFWGGYILKPNIIEFWQGRPSRLHDRLRYANTSDGWKIERLAP